MGTLLLFQIDNHTPNRNFDYLPVTKQNANYYENFSHYTYNLYYSYRQPYELKQNALFAWDDTQRPSVWNLYIFSDEQRFKSLSEEWGQKR